ncbi:MAG: hypothetical protein PHH96_10430 [Smithellaceae bacterium]|jgi:hypothetical protein|nr:hypothetical protein [Smithellaceae bacterium]MDD5415223.1 hypothetical protein [Smithellaceae bacterium]HBJ75645.1 hypothetical protein [Syntrophaceae bacterium]
MKKGLPVFAFILILFAAGDVFAVDMTSLDKVAIFMSKAKVLSILGASQEVVTLGKGLKVEVYPVESALPLTHSGCIYGQDGVLMGQSFVFQGHTAGKIADRLKKHGFTPLPQKDGALRFAGVDDDTGRPLVAAISENDNLTTITTFEKAFYEAHVQ